MSGHLILGKDVANDNYVPISVDSSGHLDIDVQVADLDSKCMGSETGATDGTQHQLRVDNTGALHIISENSDSMVIKGVETGTTTQRDCKQNSNGDLRSALVGNTAKDGSGTNYYVVVDGDGKLETSGGGDATAANQTTQIANDATIIARIATTNSTLGDTNSKIDAMRGTSDLGVINTSLGTVNTSIGTSNTTLTDIEAHQGNIENNLSSIQSTVSSNKLQVDVITTALPTGAATETTLAAAEVHLGAIDTATSSIQSNVSTSSNQGTMITSLASLAGCVSGTELQVDIVSGGGGGGGGDASAANQTTMITHLSEIEGAVETIETCVSGTELQVDVITSALPSGAATQATLADVEAHQGNIENNLSSIQSTVSSNKLQVDVITSALPSGAATEATLAAAEAHLGTIDTSTASVAGCVSGTEVQVDVRNRTDSAPIALTFAAGNKVIAASGLTKTGTIDVSGCSSYVIMMNMLLATTNSSEFSNCSVSIEYSPDDGSTFMGTSSSGGGGLETIDPLPLYQASGASSSAVVGYGVYIQSTANMSSPLMGVARTNKIKIAVQNVFGSSLTLDTFAIYKFN